MKVRGEVDLAHRKWQVWQEAMELAEIVYKLDLEEESPQAITPHLLRAAVSVPANIAEGAGRGGNYTANHMKFAKGSLME